MKELLDIWSKPRPALVKGAPRCLIYNQLKMLQNFESVFTACFSPVCLLAHMELRGKGLGCYCGFTRLQLFHAPFFDILWIPKDPQATPWETTACKDKVENLYFMYHWSSMILQENQEEENHGLWFHCKKELSYCNNKGFSSNKTRQVWSCCAVSTPRSQGRASHAANAPRSPQGKDHRANRFRPTFLRRAVVQTRPSFLSLPREWEAVRCKDAALAKWPFPCLFLSSRRMDSLNAINVLVKPSCSAPCTHSSWQSSVLWTPCGYCVVLSPHLPWRSQSLNHLNKVVLVRVGYTLATQLRNAGIWDFSGKALLKDLWGVLY